MINRKDWQAKLEQAFAKEPRLKDVSLAHSVEQGGETTLILEGEVDSVAQKRLALERAASIPGIDGLVDRVRVRPAEEMKDRPIRQHLCQALYGESAFKNIDINERLDGEVIAFRAAPEPAAGEIFIEVAEGIVTLSGAVPSLEHKRLAGVLAWWVPGSRDVIIGLEVSPPEEDTPDRIEEAVRIALDNDPLVNAGQIKVGVRERIVRLTGTAVNEEQRHMAECDAWYVFGVDDVINEIKVISG